MRSVGTVVVMGRAVWKRKRCEGGDRGPVAGVCVRCSWRGFKGDGAGWWAGDVGVGALAVMGGAVSVAVIVGAMAVGWWRWWCFGGMRLVGAGGWARGRRLAADMAFFCCKI